MNRKQLEAAAFWDHLVCTSCEAEVDDAAAQACPECGGEAIYPATLILAHADFVEREEE